MYLAALFLSPPRSLCASFTFTFRTSLFFMATVFLKRIANKIKVYVMISHTKQPDWSERASGNVYWCMLYMHVFIVNISVFRYAELISLCFLSNTIFILATSSHAVEIGVRKYCKPGCESRGDRAKNTKW